MEGLLQSSTNFEAQPNTDGGDKTPTGASATATPVVVLSTLVALCGSFCTSCAESTIHKIIVYIMLLNNLSVFPHV